MTALYNPHSSSPAAPAGNAPAKERVTYLTPLVNVSESADGYVLEAEMPGVNKEGLEVRVENGELIIHGRRANQNASQPLYRESRPQDYRRVFELDASIDSAKISAKIDQGVLRLVLPKADSLKPRKIEIA